MFEPALSVMWVPGGQELIIILIVVLILFGGTKLPQLMRGMGTGIKEFKQAIKEDDDKPADDKSDSEGK